MECEAQIEEGRTGESKGIDKPMFICLDAFSESKYRYCHCNKYNEIKCSSCRVEKYKKEVERSITHMLMWISNIYCTRPNQNICCVLSQTF